jgi:hypothetical protein
MLPESIVRPAGTSALVVASAPSAQGQHGAEVDRRRARNCTGTIVAGTLCRPEVLSSGDSSAAKGANGAGACCMTRALSTNDVSRDGATHVPARSASRPLRETGRSLEEIAREDYGVELPVDVQKPISQPKTTKGKKER